MLYRVSFVRTLIDVLWQNGHILACMKDNVRFPDRHVTAVLLKRPPKSPSICPHHTLWQTFGVGLGRVVFFLPSQLFIIQLSYKAR